ncbi:MAG: TonB family protein [Gemmatimonadetes bacterium]|jgi:protein TonB|nr:TonB family protein [Gemmatimonadota bacterium]
MANGVAGALPAPFKPTTANDRLKGSFNSWFWGSIAAAALIHFLVIAFWPDMTAVDPGSLTREMQAVDIPPVVEIPPPPQDIPRPAVPVLSTNIDISDEITIQDVTFDANPVENLPPPPTGAGVDLSETPAFTPRTVEPELRPAQRTALQRHLERNYPPTLRDAGIGARVVLWVFINEQGQVQNTRVQESSGYPAFDQVAEQAMRAVTFSPAMNRDQRVPVWVALPVSFQTQ